MIEVLVNNKPHHFSPDTSLRHLLEEIRMTDPKGVAIAINDEVVPKNNWSNRLLKNADKILIIKASQGG